MDLTSGCSKLPAHNSYFLFTAEETLLLTFFQLTFGTSPIPRNADQHYDAIRYEKLTCAGLVYRTDRNQTETE